MTAPAYEVDVNSEQVKEVINLFEFIGGNSTRAIRIAINKTLPIAKTAVSAAVRKELKITATIVREKLDTTPASGKNLIGSVNASPKGRLLSRYSTNPEIRGAKVSLLYAPKVPAGGIKVEVKPKQRKVLQGSKEGTGDPFYLILPNNDLGIAQRRKNPGPKGGRLKILYGPSVSQGFNKLKEKIPVADIYQTKLLDSINYLLRKKHPPA